jgi:hypothetical protein
VKFWVGVLVVSPLWGFLSTQLFIQAWLAVAGLVCGSIGLLRGRVEPGVNLIAIGTGLASVILWCALLRAGFWLLVDVLELGASGAENTVYWICAVVFALGSIPQIVLSVRNAWRFAMVPGALDQFSLDRRMDAAYRKAAAKAA